MKIYVAGPLSAPEAAVQFTNIQAAVDAAIAVWKRGHIPYIPHLSYYVDVRASEIGTNIGYENWLRVDFSWLALCDGFLYLSSSPGADRELAEAKRLGLAIYQAVDEIPLVALHATQPQEALA